jgi:hypothetical protein
MKVDL